MRETISFLHYVLFEAVVIALPLIVIHLVISLGLSEPNPHDRFYEFNWALAYVLCVVLASGYSAVFSPIRLVREEWELTLSFLLRDDVSLDMRVIDVTEVSTGFQLKQVRNLDTDFHSGGVNIIVPPWTKGRILRVLQ